MATDLSAFSPLIPQRPNGKGQILQVVSLITEDGENPPSAAEVAALAAALSAYNGALAAVVGAANVTIAHTNKFLTEAQDGPAIYTGP